MPRPFPARRASELARLNEAVSRAAAISLETVGREVVRVRTPRPATLFGSGQVERLAADIAGQHAELVVIDSAVTPIQQRNLEKAFCAQVSDRTGDRQSVA